MTKPISGPEMLAKMLKELSSRTSPTWVQVLGNPSNRNLLALIAQENPQSVGQLSELAGRAQPNVSRSLAALIESGLITLQNEGRRSVPRLTPLAIEKAAEAGVVLERTPGPSNNETPAVTTGLGFSIEWRKEQPPSDLDRIEGSVIFAGRSRTGSTGQARHDGDVVELAQRLTDHWWRMIYRADAPFILADFLIMDGSGAVAGCEAKSLGQRIHVSFRADAADPTPSATFDRAHFESHLLDVIVKPAVKALRSRHWYGRPLESNLHEIEEIQSYPAELSFFRTMGALGLARGQVNDDRAQAIRNLIVDIENEDVRLDLASAVLAEGLDDSQDWIARAVSEGGNRLPGLTRLRKACSSAVSAGAKKPWQIGIACAKAVRREIDAAADRSLKGADCLLRAVGTEESINYSSEPPASLLAIQSITDGDPIVAVPNRGQVASTFIMARAIGDYIAFGNRTACVTELYTDRQAVGRAFAAELLAPSEAVVQMVYEDKSVHTIAAHFGVAPDVVRHQFDNNSGLARTFS